MYFEVTSMIQKLPEDLEALFPQHGWELHGKYRAFAPLTGDSYRKRFAEVRLFKSLGSDKQQRFFGFIHAYGVAAATPLGQEPIITQSSELGYLGTGDGVKTVFKFPVKPVLGHLSAIYFDGVEQKDLSKFTIDNEKGTVTFNTAPGTGVDVRSTYALSDNAPSMPSRLYFFTFDDIRDERVVLPDTPEGQCGPTDGIKTTYDIPTGGKTIKAGTVSVYVGTTLQDPATYTVDYVNNRITFNAAPTTNSTVNVSYIALLTKNAEGSFGDFKVSNFDPTKPDEFIDAAFKVVNYILPSFPTAVSFIPDDKYTLGWYRDSAIYQWGNATKDRVMMFFKVDPAPDPTKTFYTPLYIGRLSTIGKAPKRNNVIAAGCRAADEVKYAAGKKFGNYIVDYGGNTCNGNSGVALQQSVGGAYYQTYYLSFITHDVAMEESFESRFNPSVYTGKYHISPVYVVHPNDGYVGRLDEVYAIHPKNISQMDELEVTESTKNEELGIGDGVKKVFHFFHKPDGNPVIKVGCVEQTTGYTIDDELKTITFDVPPGNGLEILADYDYNQVYKYTLPDTPVSTFNLEKFSPYKPIGLGVLKENL